MKKYVLFSNIINTLTAIWAYYLLITAPSLFVGTLTVVYGVISILNWSFMYSDYLKAERPITSFSKYYNDKLKNGKK